MIKVLLCLFVLSLSGCATNPKDYEWYVQYNDGQKKTAYVDWYNDENSCIGMKLYVPSADNRFVMPEKIVRVHVEKKTEKQFHMCDDSKHPDGNFYNYFDHRPKYNAD